MDVDLLKERLSGNTANVLAQLLMILLVLLVTWLARRVVERLLPRLSHFLTQRTRTTLDEQLLIVVQPPLRLLITVVGLWVVLLLLNLPGDLQQIVDHTMASLVMITLFWGVYRSVDLVVSALWTVGKRTLGTTAGTERSSLLDQKLGLMLGQLTKALIIIFAITLAMDEWGYSVGGLVAGLGIGGLAVALAAQDALANLIGYFVILADEPFVVGEYVVIGEASGLVEQLGFRSTRLRVSDQSLVTVPNKTVASTNITNWSRLTKRRLNMTLALSHDSAPNQILAVLQSTREMLQAHPLVHDDSVIVQFTDFNDTSLGVTIICFMKTPAWADFQAARQDINLKIMTIMAEYGVGFASPSYVVSLQQKKIAEALATPARPLTPPEIELAGSTATDSPVPADAAN